MRRLAASLVLLGVLLAQVGCTDPGPQLIDDTGLVREWVYRGTDVQDMPDALDESRALYAILDEAGASKVTPPEGWDVRVIWMAGLCHNAPTIQVRGSSSAVTAIEINRGPEPRFTDCPDALAVHAVDLRLDPAVDSNAVAVSGR